MGVKDLVVKEKRPELAELLKTHSYLEAGRALGIEDELKNPTNVRNTIRRVWEDIKKNPEENGVSRETVDEVDEILKSRKVETKKSVQTTDKLKESLAKAEFPDLVTGVQTTRDDILMLMRKKLNQLYNDEKELSKLNLATLTTSFGILFDKSQVAKGEATEHIAIHAKIDREMSPEERIKAVAEIRENLAQNK